MLGCGSPAAGQDSLHVAGPTVGREHFWLLLAPREGNEYHEHDAAEPQLPELLLALVAREQRAQLRALRAATYLPK